MKTPAEFVDEFYGMLAGDGVYMIKKHRDYLVFKVAQRDKMLECSECGNLGGTV